MKFEGVGTVAVKPGCNVSAASGVVLTAFFFVFREPPLCHANAQRVHAKIILPARTIFFIMTAFICVVKIIVEPQQ